MAEEQGKTQASEKPATSGKRRQTLTMLGILLFVMTVEGGGIYFAVKFLGGGPQSAVAEGLTTTVVGGGNGDGHGGGGHAATDIAADAELQVTKLKAPNMKSGRLFLYDIEIYAKTKKEKSETLQKLLESYKATIDDRLSRVVRSAEPQDLQEDGLETIRRQVKHELGQIVGDEKMVEAILIPKCTPFKVDY